jgi:hypothetical protein
VRPARDPAVRQVSRLLGARRTCSPDDLLRGATFQTLYESWEQALDGLGDSPAILRGEEVLFHIG